MLRLSRWIAVVAILLSASVAFAQRPGGGGPGGFGGGFGGGPGGGVVGPLMLINIEAVQKDLGLKEDQISKLKTIGEQSREEMRSAFTGGFGGRDQSDEERAKAREKMAESIKKVNEILDASQRDRLKQIGWQFAGPQAYQNAEVVEALKISKEQQDKLAAVAQEFLDKQRDLAPRGGQGGGGGERPNFEEMRKKRTELNEARDKALSEVLTADQRDQFAKLMGKKFDTAQLRGGFGGPGGGRPGQAGGGANPAGRPQRRAEGGDKKKDSN
jgi:Spy/CpxP family protein refolding chaperone